MNPGAGITFVGPEDVRTLEALLTGFLTDTEAHCALVADRSGRLLTTVGDTGTMDQVTFASLVAGDFAASDQLASLLGEQEFNSLYHQGENRSMYLADVGGWAILAALFDGRTTLGMVRLKSKTVVPKLASLLADLATRSRARADLGLESGWIAEAESEIDRLFAD